MYRKGFQLYVQQGRFYRGVQLHLTFCYEKNGISEEDVLRIKEGPEGYTIEAETLKPGLETPGSSFDLDFQSAQHLYDQLTQAGFRSTQPVDTTAATQKHLEDMRTIAFHSLQISGLKKDT